MLGLWAGGEGKREEMGRDMVSNSPNTCLLEPLMMFSKGLVAQLFGRIVTLETSSKKPHNFLSRTSDLVSFDTRSRAVPTVPVTLVLVVD